MSTPDPNTNSSDSSDADDGAPDDPAVADDALTPRYWGVCAADGCEAIGEPVRIVSHDRGTIHRETIRCPEHRWEVLRVSS